MVAAVHANARAVAKNARTTGSASSRDARNSSAGRTNTDVASIAESAMSVATHVLLEYAGSLCATQ